MMMASFNLTSCSFWGSLSSDGHLVGAGRTFQFIVYAWSHKWIVTFKDTFYTLAQCVSIEHFWSNAWYLSHTTIMAIENSRNRNWKWKTESEKLKLKPEISSNACKSWASYFILHVSLKLICSYVYRTAS